LFMKAFSDTLKEMDVVAWPKAITQEMVSRYTTWWERNANCHLSHVSAMSSLLSIIRDDCKAGRWE